MKNMQKKGMELTINTIIIAVLSLVALAILIGLFVRQTGRAGQEYTGIYEQVKPGDNEKCASLVYGRACVPTTACTGEGKTVRPEWTDCGSGKVCCETF